MNPQIEPTNPMSDLLDRLEWITSTDLRYKKEAYFFVMTALNRAVEKLERFRHVSGAELLEAIREEAQEQFGPMAQSVFNHWGVKNSLDFGRIVFNMVQESIFSKTESDALEDFRDAGFFETLFDEMSGYCLEAEESVAPSAPKAQPGLTNTGKASEK